MLQNELRVGNWIWYYPEAGEREYLKIITPDIILLATEHNSGAILLTDELLETCGFKKDGDYFRHPDLDQIELLPKGGNTYAVETVDVVLCEVSKVHELQNLAFSLLKEDLSIFLNEVGNC